MTDKPIIAVWFSNGAASAVAAHLTLQKYGASHDVRIINNPVIEEDEDNLRFGADIEAWLGVPIIKHYSPKFPAGSAVEVWDKRKAMNFPNGAPCTIALKKEARQDYERQHKIVWHVLGFTSEETHRFNRFVMGERRNTLPILIEAALTKQGCIDYLLDAGIKLPGVYAEGYPNANCIGCVKATSPTYWNLVRKTRPEVFEQRAEQSRRLGAKLTRVNGKRIYLDELPADAKGRSIKSMSVECGIFCEEK